MLGDQTCKVKLGLLLRVPSDERRNGRVVEFKLSSRCTQVCSKLDAFESHTGMGRLRIIPWVVSMKGIKIYGEVYSELS